MQAEIFKSQPISIGFIQMKSGFFGFTSEAVTFWKKNGGEWKKTSLQSKSSLIWIEIIDNSIQIVESASALCFDLFHYQNKISVEASATDRPDFHFRSIWWIRLLVVLQLLWKITAEQINCFEKYVSLRLIVALQAIIISNYQKLIHIHISILCAAITRF